MCSSDLRFRCRDSRRRNSFDSKENCVHCKTAEVKDLISKYGATKLSDVDEGKYKDLLKDAEGIEID